MSYNSSAPSGLRNSFNPTGHAADPGIQVRKALSVANFRQLVSSTFVLLFGSIVWRQIHGLSWHRVRILG